MGDFDVMVSFARPFIPPGGGRTQFLVSVVGSEGGGAKGGRPVAANLGFVLDVSGSMQSENKYDLLRQAMERLLGTVREGDRTSVVIFSNADSSLGSNMDCGNAHQLAKEFDAKARGSGNFGGGTNMSGAIDRLAADMTAMMRENPAAARMAYFMTDGQVHDEAAAIVSVQRFRALEVQVEGIGFGTDWNPAFFDRFLSGFGTQTVFAHEVNTILERFKGISQTVQNLAATNASLEIKFTGQPAIRMACRWKPVGAFLDPEKYYRARERRFVVPLGNLEKGKVYSYLFECDCPAVGNDVSELLLGTVTLSYQAGANPVTKTQRATIGISGDEKLLAHANMEVIEAAREAPLLKERNCDRLIMLFGRKLQRRRARNAPPPQIKACEDCIQILKDAIKDGKETIDDVKGGDMMKVLQETSQTD